MNDRSLSSVAQDARLVEVLDAYLAGQEGGAPPDVDEFLALYPELADELRECLASLAFISRAGLSVAGEISAEGEMGGGVLGDFRILREVGKGGMGVVYEAEQISLRRRVALKVLPFAATMDPRHLQRFHNEARAAACLHHAHIVPVYFVGCERGVHFYAMQFIEGQSLAELIAAQRHESTSGVVSASRESQALRALTRLRSLSAPTQPIAAAITQSAARDAAHYRRIAKWGIQAAEALEHAHSLGIVHRDIKPSNLLIDDAGRLWITDFGLARTATDAGLTMTGDVIGTLRYMSPEQALAKHDLVGYRTDIYALGATLYELLTLRPTVEGKDREEILRKIAFEELTLPRSLDRAVPADLETIVLKALAKELAERYATAQEMAEDLRRFVDDKPIRARRPSLLQRMRKWARRNTAVIRTAATILVLAVAALAAGGVWHLFEIQRRVFETQAALAEVRHRELEVRQHLYIQDIVLAWHALREGERERVHDLLDSHLPEDGQEDRRGFAWYYLQRRSRGLLHETARIKAHEGAAYCVRYSPDGRTLASAGKDGAIRFWDARTLRPQGELHGGQGEINEVVFAPDGKTLASAGDDGTVWLWDLASRQQRAILRPEGRLDELETLALSPDGKVLAAGGRDGRIWSWDYASGKLKAARNPDLGSIHYLTFAPDGRSLAAAHESGRVLLLDPATLLERGQFHPFGQVHCVAFSHDGKTLVADSGGKGRILRWDPAARVQRADLPGHEVSPIQSLSFSPDDTLLASAGEDGRVRLWDVRSGRLCASRRGHIRSVWSTAFAPDGEWLATAGQDGIVKVWHVSDVDHPRTIRVARREQPGILVDCVAFSPDGKTLFTRTNGGELGRWSTRSGQPTEPAGEPGASIARPALAPGSRLVTIAVDKKELRVQNLSGAVVQVYQHAHPISALAVSPDGESVAFADVSPAVWIWEIGPGRPRELARLSGVCECLAFAPNGGTIAIAADARVFLLDIARGQSLAVLSGHEREIVSLAFSPDGRLLATAAREDNTIRIWELPSGRERYSLWKHRRAVTAVAFSPDGKTLASGATGEVIVWNVAGGQELIRLDDHRGAIFALAFSPDGKLLAAGGQGTDADSAEVTLWYGDGAQSNLEP